MSKSTRKKRNRRGDDAAEDYAVGYARPPVATRFKPGQSGNLKGRAKRPKTVAKIIEEAMATRVSFEEKGRRRSLTAQEVIIRNLVGAAARRDIRAIHAVFALKDRYQDSPDTTLDPAALQPEDRQIIEDYLANLKGSSGPGGSPSSAKAEVQPTENSHEPKQQPTEEPDSSEGGKP